MLVGMLERLPSAQDLPDVGEDPDPRFTMANERTFLAWNRTGLALIAAGLAGAQLIDVGAKWAVAVFSVVVVSLGTAIVANSYRQWVTVERRMRLGQPIGYSRLPRVLVIGITVAGLMAAGLAVAAALD